MTVSLFSPHLFSNPVNSLPIDSRLYAILLFFASPLIASLVRREFPNPEQQKNHHESTPVEYASLPLRGFNGARERTKTRKRNYVSFRLPARPYFFLIPNFPLFYSSALFCHLRFTRLWSALTSVAVCHTLAPGVEPADFSRCSKPGMEGSDGKMSWLIFPSEPFLPDHALARAAECAALCATADSGKTLRLSGL
jgi:hypothetical protein